MKTTESPEVYGDVLALNIDIANDFARPTGTLYVHEGEQVIAPMNAINKWVRSQNGQTLFTQDWHPLGTKHFAVSGGNWPIHCVEDTYGAELHNDLIVRPEDLIVHKGMSMVDDGYSAFEGTIVNGESTGMALTDYVFYREQMARRRRQRLAVIFGGIATDFCDKASVLDGLDVTDRATTDIIIVPEAMRAVNLKPGDGDAAIAAMIEAGALAMTTEEIVNGGIIIDKTRLER